MAETNRESRLKAIDERKAMIEQKLETAKANANRQLKIHEKLQVKLVGIVLAIMFVVATSLTTFSSFMASESVNLTLEKSFNLAYCVNKENP